MTLLEAMRSRPRVRTEDFRDTDELDAAVLAIQTAFPGYDQTPRLKLEQLLVLLGQKLESWEWHGIKVGDVAVIVRAVFSEHVRVSGGMLDFLRREVSATTNPALLQTVCEVYVATWERSTSRTVWLANVIQERSQYLPLNWKTCFLSHPQLLDVEAAPQEMAAKMVFEQDPFYWLVRSGVAAPHSGRLMRELHFAWLKALPEPRSIEDVSRIFAWMFPLDQPVIEGDMASSAIEKLLEPWLATPPGGELKKLLLTQLVEVFGDPRNQRADFWALVGPAYKRVLVRWLAGESMDALLSVITNSTANHMWPPRHAFWKGLYDRGLIDEAWVALSSSAYHDAGSMFQRTQNHIYTMSGKQVAKSRKDTCLLIMRIGRFTIVEGSHDYRIHVFQSSDPAAPQFYEDEYDAEEMTLPLHHRNTRIHDQYGQWMRWVEQSVLR